jgi:hypothetical protein
MLRTLALSLAAAWTLAAGAPAAAQTGYVHGMFVGTPDGPIELTAYAEATTTGQLRMAKGTIGNVPTLSNPQRILCNLPNWHPGGVVIATHEIFRDERAERRELPFATRRLNMSALEVRVEDIERKDLRAGLVKSVGGSDKTPVYVFVIMATNGLSRYYPFRVTLD